MAASDSVAPKLFAGSRTAANVRRPTISREKFQRILGIAETFADLVTCGLSMFFACLSVRGILGEDAFPQSLRTVAAVSIGFGMAGAFLMRYDSLHSGSRTFPRIRETERILRASMLASALAILSCLSLNLSSFAGTILAACAITPILLISEKLVLFLLVRVVHASGYGVERVLIYGEAQAGQHLASVLSDSPRLGLRPVGIITNAMTPEHDRASNATFHCNCSVPVAHAQLTAAILKACQANVLIVTDSAMSSEDAVATKQAAEQVDVRVVFLCDASDLDSRRIGSIKIDDFILTRTGGARKQLTYSVVKRGIDILVSSLLLILLAPLFILCAILICLDSPGPAFFVQKRVGRNGKLFSIYKFRSMHVDTAKYDFSPVSSHDRRITGVGRILRHTSLDELPQLINVLLGSMSLVGPRPEMPFIVERYNATHRKRLLVTPGITGLWQLSAGRSRQIHENIQYDLDYIRNRSFFLDISILIHTLFFAMRGV